MSEQIRFQQLLSYFESWRENPSAEIGTGLLATVGFLRRAGLPSEQLERVREIEVGIRRDFERILAAYAEFMAKSTLCQMAGELARAPGDEELLLSFYQARDEAELALQLAREYTEDERPPNWHFIGEISKNLKAVDDEILWNREVVSQIRAIGALEPVVHYDSDFFWWLSPEGDCYLPSHRRDEYLAGYVDGLLPTSCKAGFLRHLLTCPLCRREEAMLKETLLIQELGYRSKLVGSAFVGDPTSLSRHVWQDADSAWEMVLFLEESLESRDSQRLCLAFESKGRQEVNWQEARLQMGDLNLEISAEGYTYASRLQLQEALKQGHKAILCVASRQIELLYRGREIR